MREIRKIMMRIRVLYLAGLSLAACGPTTGGMVGPRFHHSLLNRGYTHASPAGPTAVQAIPARSRVASIGQVEDVVGRRLALARRARGFLRRGGSGGFRANGRTYRRDCSGFVLAVYAAEGVDIRALVRGINGPGRGKDSVSGIFRAARKLGLIHRHKVPAVGDLVFFDHTYDRNRDGRPNDPLTHMGLVESVDPDGTVTVIHHVQRGVLRYRMSRFEPDLRRDPATRRVLNHYLRIGPPRSSARGLTGQLFHAFATVIR